MVKNVDQNSAAILDAILRYGPISRQDLLRHIPLSHVKVGQIVRDLFEEGILQAGELGRSKGGRRPQLLQISDRVGFILGVEIYPDYVTALLTDVHLNIIEQVRKPSEIREGECVSRIESIKETIHELIARSGITQGEILGIGLACPGTLDVPEGRALSCSNLGPDWHDVPIVALIEDDLNLPVFLEHDVRAMALAEHRLGIGQGADNLIFVNVGIGVGASVIVDGSVLRGERGFAGELGHIIIDENGPRCGCGNVGCLQAFVSTPAIVAYVRNALERGTRSRINELIGGDLDALSFKRVCTAAEQGDRLAVTVIERMGSQLGKAIAMMVTLFNPKQVVLGRDAVLAGEMMLNRIRHIVRVESLLENSQCVEVAYSSLGANAAPLGAASVVRDRLFELVPVNTGRSSLPEGVPKS